MMSFFNILYTIFSQSCRCKHSTGWAYNWLDTYAFRDPWSTTCCIKYRTVFGWWVVVLFINKNARMLQSCTDARMPQSCTGCTSHLAVWCHCYSVATRALGLCISCLRCRDVVTSRLLWLITYVLGAPSADGIPFQVDLSTSRSKSKSTSRPTTMQPVYSYFVSLSEGGIYDIGTEILLL